MKKGCPDLAREGGGEGGGRVISIRTGRTRAKACKCIGRREEERRRGVENERASERGLVHLNESHR